MRRTLNPEDLHLWWLNTQDITPLRDGLPKPDTLKRQSRKKTIPKHALHPQPKSQPAQAPFRHKQRQALRKQSIEAELDLHGYTQNQAWDALLNFLPTPRQVGKRTVLVITGKGSLASDQTLRVQVPRWLEDPLFSKHILGYQKALQKDGGTGAYYVYLKRNK